MPIDRQWRVRCMAVVASFLIAACGPVEQSPNGSAGIPAGGSAPPETAAAIPEELLDTLRLYEGDGDPSQSPIHAVWAALLPTANADLEPPSAIVQYRAGEVPDFACADQLEADQWAGNAFYCPTDQSIAYDLNFVAGLVEAVDESAAPAILAHEWGHHIQSLIGTGEFDIQRELQADCFAGLFASKTDETGADVTASVESAEAFYNLGNERYSNAHWFDVEEHGSPWQRLAAWSLGYLSVELGVEFCRGYSGWEPGQIAQIGPFAFVQFPGRSGDVEADRYVLEDEALGRLTIEHVDVSGLAGPSPRDLLAEWAEEELGATIGSIQMVDVVNPDEFAALYYTADPDAAAGIYRRHGVIGLQVSPDDAGGALIFDRPASGSPAIGADPPEGNPGEESYQGALEALQVILMASQRMCAPHHTQGGRIETHNEMCFPDL